MVPKMIPCVSNGFRFNPYNHNLKKLFIFLITLNLGLKLLRPRVFSVYKFEIIQY